MDLEAAKKRYFCIKLASTFADTNTYLKTFKIFLICMPAQKKGIVNRSV